MAEYDEQTLEELREQEHDERSLQDLREQIEIKKSLESQGKEGWEKPKAIGKQTAKEMIEQRRLVEGMETRGKEKLFKEVRKKMERREGPSILKKAVKSVRSFVEKGFAKEVPSRFVIPGKKVGVFERKVIHEVAPRGSVVEKLTRPTVKTIKGAKGKPRVKYGRGRPTGTYKVRVLPYSGKRVKVPTHIYKKMLSAEKSQYRLAQAERMGSMQMEAEQLAMQQDPRYRPGAEEQFLAEPDMQHEEALRRAQERAQMTQFEPQRSSTMSKATTLIQNFGRGLSRLGGVRGTKRPMQVDQYEKPIQQAVQPQRINLFGGQGGSMMTPRQRILPQTMKVGPITGGLKREPRVTAVSGRANLLGVRNQFNRRKRR